MAELMLGQPLFPGESGIDQLVEIIKVLGTPTRDQIRTMNPNYMEHKFPQIKPHPFSKVFRKADANAIDLISRLLEYTPTQRLSAIDAMVHPFSMSFATRTRSCRIRATRMEPQGNCRTYSTSLIMNSPSHLISTTNLCQRTRSRCSRLRVSTSTTCNR